MPNENEKLAAERSEVERTREGGRRVTEEAKGRTARNGVVVGLKAPHKLLISHEGRDVVLNGTPEHHPADRSPGLARHEVIGGYGLTENVDPDFIEAWMRVHKQGPFVQNDLLFVEPTIERARKRAIEQASVRSGLEPTPEETPDTKPLDNKD